MAQPNIVLIVADDMGWMNVGYNGSEIRTPHLDKLALRIILLLTLSLLGYPLCAEESSIPEASIAPLQKALSSVKTSRRSVSSRRRACKKVIRTADALIKGQPEAPNRFKVLALMLSAQQLLMQMEKTQRNVDAFYETCRSLAQAPDEYIGYRLNAELLLSDRDLSAKNAEAEERIKALESMVARYRDTSAELDCLMRIIMIAPQLGALDLKKRLLESVSTRFAGDATAIAFRRKLMPTSIQEVLFAGTFERPEGPSMVFPQDRLGHSYFVVFWSKDSAKAIKKLEQLKKEQQTIPDAIEVYSLNVDELPDCGKSILDSIGVRCTTLRLSGGRSNEAYRAYALYDFASIRVNHLGYTRILSTESARKKSEPGSDKTLTEEEVGLDDLTIPVNEQFLVGISEFDRYFAQLQYVFIGDYLVTANGLPAATPEGGVSAAAIKAIDACFVKPPLRYRLSKSEALANYKKANELATQAITNAKPAADRWRLQNYRIVALMGMANLSGSADHFEEAVKESRKVLAQPLPKGADVPARFCLARSALRNRPVTPQTVIETFIADCGGKNAGFTAYGAACVLAMAANSQELYHRYHTAVLESNVPSPALNAFASFFRDRHHQYYLFKISPNLRGYRRLQRFAERRHMINNSLTPRKDPLPPFDVKTVDGKTLSFPETKADKLTVLVFVEPPAKGDELPPHIYSPAKEPSKDVPNPTPGGDLGHVLSMASNHVNKGVNVAVVFLSDNVAQVKAIQQKYALPETVALLPGGVSNPIVNRLGLLSPDRLANLVLVRRDGTIAWTRHGLRYHNIGKNRPYVTMDGLRHHVIVCDIEEGYRALKAKNYSGAMTFFTENLVHEFGHDHKWNSSLAHGRALVNLALKNYELALKEIETAIAVHLKVSPGRWPQTWEFNHSPDKPCSSMLHMLTTKAKILDRLGRNSEARAARNTISKGSTVYPTFSTRIMGFDRPYEDFENRMSDVAKEIK